MSAPNQIRVVNSTESISVTLVPDRGWPLACCDADWLGDRWWVSRTLVRVHQNRGQGLGSRVLERLLQEISSHPCPLVHVSPGGYGNDIERQTRFYLKNGFLPTQEPGLLEWRPK